MEIYRKAKKPTARTPAESEDLEARLLDATEKLAAMQSSGEEPGDSVEVVTLGMSSGARLAVEAKGESEGVRTLSEGTHSSPERAPDLSRFRQVTSMIDWAVFFATFLVSAIVYMVALYNGKHFGAFSQYIEAFGAGYVGQVFVGVATLPLARSLSAVIPKEPSKT